MGNDQYIILDVICNDISVDVFKPKMTIFRRSIPYVPGTHILHVLGLNVSMKQQA